MSILGSLTAITFAGFGGQCPPYEIISFLGFYFRNTHSGARYEITNYELVTIREAAAHKMAFPGGSPGTRDIYNRLSRLDY